MADERKRPRWPWVVLALLALPVLYVFSIGPVNRLITKGYISRPVVDRWIAPFYDPLSRGRER